MLERTAGCLESGSLRRLLPATIIKSRRTLHPSFWSHGARDLEVSPLWTALVRMAVPEHREREADVHTRHSTMAGSGMKLDFLFPAETLHSLRRNSGWGFGSRQGGGRLARNDLEKIGYRQYTSSAKDNITDATGLAVDAEVIGNDALSLADNTSMQMLYESLSLTSRFDFEEAWRQFSLLEPESEQRPLRKHLIRYLIPSERIVDAERIISLFHMLGPGEKTALAYRYTIRSYLRVGDLDKAMALHLTGLKTLTVPAGSDELLAYFAENSLWSQAYSLWQQVHEFRGRSGVRISYNIFEALDQSPSLASQALELAAYVNKSIGDDSPEYLGDFSGLTNFASKVVRRALLDRQTFNQSRFLALLAVLRNWKMATPFVYHQAIDMLSNLQETKLAVRCYREARRESDLTWDRPTLHTLLKIFCDYHSVAGMQAVLDDFFRIYSSPTRKAYKMCMWEFAAQGDAQTVHALFDQMRQKNRIRDVDDLAPVLHVHAKRGEVQDVVAFFQEIRDVYGLVPNLVCWNILLSAYGKIHDSDRAYECFEEILGDEKLRPDEYTFGTIMGICTTRGDVDRVIGLYKLADQMQIPKSAAMIDNLVLSHIRDGDVDKAETICEEAVGLELKGSRTRMWNYLLVAHAMQRDLLTVNRLLQRMSEIGVDYDTYTYSALMLVLCMVKQPDRARAILQDVMPQAGCRSTPFHYAVVMGGFLVTGEFRKVFKLSNRMVKRNVRGSASSKLVALQAQVAEDERLAVEGTVQEVRSRALEMFQEAIASMDPQDVSDTARKGAMRAPVDILYPTMFYRYIIFVIGRCSDFSTVDELYEAFKNTLPSYRQSVPLEILHAMMRAKLAEKDFDTVQQCWDLALAHAKKAGAPLTEFDDLPEDHMNEVRNEKILPARQLDLAKHLSIYLESLYTHFEMTRAVNSLMEDGFMLDNQNWNTYIELLARRHAYKLAFELCETHLMDGWSGWARVRWSLPERNRLPLEVRNAKKQPRYLRPTYRTILYLARGYLELQSMAAESADEEELLRHVETHCPRLVRAIVTMQRVDDHLERTVLRGD